MPAKNEANRSRHVKRLYCLPPFRSYMNRARAVPAADAATNSKTFARFNLILAPPCLRGLGIPTRQETILPRGPPGKRWAGPPTGWKGSILDHRLRFAAGPRPEWQVSTMDHR